MKDRAQEGNRKKLSELLEKELLFLEIVRKLRVSLAKIVDRLESFEQLAEELKACQTEIVKRHFFPINKTIDTFAKQPLAAEEELIKTTQEDLSKILHFIEVIEEELTKKEKEIKELRDETKKLRGMLITG
jgi:GTPase involved in cell partitioning and DNA repair